MKPVWRPVPRAGAGLVLFAFVACNALAATGYDLDYDFPGHGADWYGRAVREELKYEYPAEPIDLFLSGDDFGAGYDRFFEHLGLGPGLEYTRLHNTEYEFLYQPGGPVTPPPITACNDGVDNDLDGTIDYPADPGCTSLADDSERDLNGPVCDDTIDNDSDGLVDYPEDPGCISPFDEGERDDTAPACDDGVDNDGDGLSDHPNDPGCQDPFDTTEEDEIISLDSDNRGLSWGSVWGVAGYDVVYGDVVKLNASGGDFNAALLACIADNHTGTMLSFEEVPERGQGFWFLVRAVFPFLNGTYDSGGPAQVAPRDPGINSSSAACR